MVCMLSVFGVDEESYTCHGYGAAFATNVLQWWCAMHKFTQVQCTCLLTCFGKRQYLSKTVSTGRTHTPLLACAQRSWVQNRHGDGSGSIDKQVQQPTLVAVETVLF